MQAQQLIKAAIDAWNRDDLDAWLATLDPGVVYHTSGVFMGLRPSYVGHDSIREFWAAMHEPWETLRLDVRRIEQVGDDGYIVEFEFRGTGAESGASVDLRFSNAGRIRDGLAVEIFAASTYDEALTRLRDTP